MAWAPPVGPEPGIEYAGAGPRFVAYIVDTLILAAIGFLISIPALVLAFGSLDWSAIIRESSGGSRFDMYNVIGPTFWVVILVSSLLSLLIQLVYFVFQWTSGSRATLGMRLLKLQVANAPDGSVITRGQAVRRWLGLGQWLSLLTYVPVLGAVSGLIEFGWALVILISTAASPTKQGVHDRIADTVVVQPRGGSGNAWIVGCLVIAVVIALLILAPIVALIFLGSQVSDILVDIGRSV